MADLDLREVARRGQQDGDHDERGGVDVERGGDPDRGDQQAREGGAADAGDGEADVHHRVALAQQTGGLEHGRHGAAREPAAGDGQRAVDERQCEDEREQEVAVGDEPDRGERGGLDHVQQRQDPPQRELVHARGQQRRQQRRQELRGDEDRSGRRDRLSAVVDQHGQSDDADGITDLVDRVGGQQPSEGTHAERSETPPRHTSRLYPLAGLPRQWTNVRFLRACRRGVCVKSVR